MALLWIDGFEGYGGGDGNPDPTGVMERRYETVSTPTELYMVEGRNGVGQALKFENSSWAWIKTPALTTDNTLILSFAFKINSGSSTTRILRMYDDITEGMSLGYSPGGSISVYRDDTLLESVGNVIKENVWCYIEFKVICHNTTGLYVVKIGGTTVISTAGADTQSGANEWHDKVRFGRIDSQTDFYIDDLSICDSTGSENNDFIGNARVVLLSPDGDDTANWGTVSPGPSHFAAVDEVIADNDTSYVEDSTANITDLYDYGALTGLGDIIGIQTNTDCRDTDGSPFELITPIESNSSQYDDSAQTIGTTNYITLMRITDTDPDTGNAWTEAGLNAAKFGIKVG